MFLLAVTHFLCTRLLMRSIAVLQGAGHRGLVAVAVVGLVAVSVLIGKSYAILLLFSLLWLLVIFVGVTFWPPRWGRFWLAQSVLVVWMLVYALSLALLLGLLSGNRLQGQTQQLARSLLQQNDRTAAYAVRIAAANLRRVPWQAIASRCATSPLACKQLQDSLIVQFFGGYLSRYNTSLFLFDARGTFKGGTRTQSFENLNTLHSKQGVPTPYEGLNYFGESFSQFGYIFKMPFLNPATNQVEGWLFSITRTSGQQQPLAPELFRQLQDFAVDLPKGYSYAWYKNRVLVDQYRNYPFPTTLPAQVSGSMYQQQGSGLYALWLGAGSSITLAIVAQRSVAISFITLVAYVFGAFLIFYALLRGLHLLVRSRFWQKSAWQGFTITLQTQIRATIVSMLLVSFVLIAVVTVLLFIGQFRTANQERLAKTVQSVATSITQNLPSQVEALAYPQRVELLKSAVFDATRSFNLDANVYNTAGALMATTQEFLFDKGVLSTMAQPQAWHRLSVGSINRFVAAETIGALQYTSIYQPLRSKSGATIGYLQVPYFASQNELNQEISNFLVIIINIIAFVFLLSGSIAYLISARITKSFNLIGQKMKQLQLSTTNERIDWERNDEIGNLVKQYNLMVDQLEQGAQKMAKTEREMAWREMARQVAHEIKNPLTPMKLSLQFLQNAISSQQPNVADITNKVAANLVEQIDHLSKIAYDFSQFANLGNTKPQPVNVYDALDSVLQLYSLRQMV
ncbi:MAG: HAMP domain-containing protein, partial [Bacteroidetes bacterium]